MKLLLSALFFLASTASAQTYTLKVIEVRSRYYTSAEAQSIVRKAVEKIQPVLGRPVVTEWRRVTDTSVFNLSQRRTAYDHYFAHASREARSTISVIIAPPLIDNGTRYLYGASKYTCNLSGIGVLMLGWNAVNQDGLSRKAPAVYGLTHELGHAFGAGHISSRTIMNSGAISLAIEGGGLPWDNRSVEQIQNCIGR